MAAILTLPHGEIPDVQLAIFDKDGTLIDIHTYWANMVLLRARLITEALGLNDAARFGLMDAMGVNANTMRIKPEGPVGLKKRELVLDAGVSFLARRGIPDTTDLFVDVFAQVDTLSLDLLHEIISPLPGLHALFDNLRSHGVAIAIATTDKAERAWLCMRHLGLADHISCIAGANTVPAPKPAPDAIFMCCKNVGISPAHSVMVGDAKSDVHCGIAAGCAASIGVASGLTPHDKLASITPHVIKDISSIHAR